MPTNRLLRTAAPIALAAFALTACGPENSAPAAAAKGTFAEPLALKTSADVSETHFPDNAKTQLSVTPASVVKGDKAAVDKLGVGLLDGKTPYYVTTTYTHKGGAQDGVVSFNHKLLLHGTDPQRAYSFAPSWGAKFEPCQEASDNDLKLAEGKSVTTCEIYLVPENVQPLFVGFQGERDTSSPSNETGTAPEVVWKVG
ncbi:hypothetical protein OG239_39890 [Streptomyces sp. NBC_00868]|uniref:hypothetical protein n=1 Tax=unclassified Streptomyces TaxID=2593676 RepID=UPI003254FF8A|nr:hypothetical protein OG239_39890 [Streptomyces sp. NBC_00868]